MYRYVDDIEATEEEFENVNYSFAIFDAEDNIIAITYDELTAQKIVEAFNKENDA